MVKSNRRKFIVTAAGLAATTVVNGTPNMDTEKGNIAHQVYFWLKNPGSEEDRELLIKGIKTLRQIDSVQKLTIGIVAATEKRSVIDDSWGVSELALFKDLAGQAAYQIHPIHLDFVKNYSHLWSKVVIYDSLEV
ncbi:Dabb family protein [Daejeonella lutea]|uniref:Stress responsive A/B Barrel Domain n=1 Tax=Daejeonella lutea TaxID=572036 RepID=A0A1T5DWU2_9SPHI|nr:Dabb family protein [Daejeonella lutea]SKB76105.1 Stress responsive A/B Barrel Domain [Daejeonella lutea]